MIASALHARSLLAGHYRTSVATYDPRGDDDIIATTQAAVHVVCCLDHPAEDAAASSLVDDIGGGLDRCGRTGHPGSAFKKQGYWPEIPACRTQ